MSRRLLFERIAALIGISVATAVARAAAPRKVVLSAARNRGNLAAKSAGQHRCKREDAALTAMPQRTRPSAASRVRCAGLGPARDPAPAGNFRARFFGGAKFPRFLAAVDRGLTPPQMFGGQCPSGQIAKNAANSCVSVAESRSSHSQTVSTLHPMLANSARFLSSR